MKLKQAILIFVGIMLAACQSPPSSVEEEAQAATIEPIEQKTTSSKPLIRSYADSPWSKKHLPDEFTFTSREWIKDEFDDIGATITVKKLTPNAYSIIFEIDPELFYGETNIMGAGFGYNLSNVSPVYFCVASRLVRQLGYTYVAWGNIDNAEKYPKNIIPFAIVVGMNKKIPIPHSYKNVELNSKVLDKIEQYPACSDAFKPEYLENAIPQ